MISWRIDTSPPSPRLFHSDESCPSADAIEEETMIVRTSRTKWACIAMPLAAAALVTAFAAPAVAAPAETVNSTAVTCFDHPCVTGIRAATHPDYDRLVFDLTGGTSVVRTYTNTTGDFTPMSGETKYLTVRGTSYLYLTMEPLHLASGLDVNKALNLPTIKGVQLTSFHAARAEFGISLGPSTRYNVFELTQPNRLVVDVYR
ncbi:AMIN-like domain-containing (lipo)protein [Streptomyces roseolus]|uniref:AMIN-like domain-containing (lipo)protein n=1 Tax=Streptomyces roseolus TaxID=67358 RepID=UPI0037B925F1